MEFLFFLCTRILSITNNNNNNNKFFVFPLFLD